MAPRVFYEYTKDAQYQEITERLRNYTLDVVENAEEGAVALSKVTIDDPLGNYDIVGWRRVYITEGTATGSNTVIYNGYVGDRTVERGPYKVGAGRVWQVTLADSNAVAQWRIMSSASANRPNETDVARVQWLMGTAEMSRIGLTEHLSTATPVAMDAVDYRGQMAMDVLSDCAQQSGKNYYIYTRDNAAGDVGLGLWYGASSLSSHASIMRLSTELPDIDEVFTFAASQETSLNRDPSRTYSGVYLTWDGGTTYEENTDTSNTYTRRDTPMSADNVKTSAKAIDRVQRLLTDLSTEEDVITTSALIPAAKVNFIRPGMRLLFKAPHLPGYEEFIWTRVLQRKVSQTESEDHYRVSLELETTGPAVGGTSSGSLLVGTMTAVIPTGGREDFSDQVLHLYPDSTYLFVNTVAHAFGPPAATSNYITIRAYRNLNTDGSGSLSPDWVKNMGALRNGTAITSYSTTAVAGPTGQPGPYPWHIKINHTSYAGLNGEGSSVSCSVYYVSGSDPRF